MVTTAVGQAPRPASGRPGWLSFFAIAGIVLGALMALTVGYELAAGPLMTAQRDLMRDVTPQAGALSELQLDMQARTMEIMARTRPPLVAIGPFGILAGVGMIVGGIGCLSLRRRARVILLGAFALGIGYEAARAKPAIDRQQQIAALTLSSMTKMMDATTARNVARAQKGDVSSQTAHTTETVQQMMATTMNAATVATVVFAVILTLLKIAFLVAGLIYLTRAPVRRLFAPAPAA
jgi:hypothetical protein